MPQLRDAIIQSIIDDPALSVKLNDGIIDYVFDFNVPDGILAKLLNEGHPSEHVISFGQVSSKKIIDLDIELPLFQFNCISVTIVKANDLKQDLISLLERFKGDLGNKRIVNFVHSINEKNLQNEDSKLYIESIDFRFKLFGNNV